VLQPLSDFLRALRAAELRVTPSEAMDAHRTAAIVGYADRALLRDALCAALAKSAEDVARFEQCFDLFFSRDLPQEDAPGRGAVVQQGATLVEMMLAGDADAIAVEMEAAARRVRVQQIDNRFQRALLVSRLLGEMGLPAIDRLLAERDGNGRRAESGDGLAEARDRLIKQARHFVERQEELYAARTARQLREERLGSTRFATISPRDFDAMAQLVRRIAKRLASQHSRRRLRSRRGMLDVGRTLRRSMGYGGIPFDTVWKRRAVTRPKIVAICDVSRSVSAAAQFLLLFLYSLNEAVDQLDAYAFSDKLADVGDLLEGRGVEESIGAILERIGFGSTDYGRAFEDFVSNHLHRVDRRTTVIILGDGRTNGVDPRLDLLREIQSRARAVIWLNPEQERSWSSGDSEMQSYRRFCRVAVSCATLRQLEQVVDEVLRSYH